MASHALTAKHVLTNFSQRNSWWIKNDANLREAISVNQL